MMQTTNDMSMLVHMMTYHVDALGRILTSNPSVVLNECGLVSDSTNGVENAMCLITEHIIAVGANATNVPSEFMYQLKFDRR
jgi:hypothetical protein